MSISHTLVAAVILTVSMAAVDNPICPEDNSSAYYTGKIRTSVNGALLYEYKCYAYGHTFWAKP